MSLYSRRVCRQIDFICRCLVSVRAMIWGLSFLLRRSCKSSIVVCIPLVLRVSANMAGWVQGGWGIGWVVDVGVLVCVSSGLLFVVWGVLGEVCGCGGGLVFVTGWSGCSGRWCCVWCECCWTFGSHALHWKRLSWEGVGFDREVLMFLLLPVFWRFGCCGWTSVVV